MLNFESVATFHVTESLKLEDSVTSKLHNIASKWLENVGCIWIVNGVLVNDVDQGKALLSNDP